MEQAQITCLCLEFQPGWKPKLWFWPSPESGSQLRPVFLLQRRNDLLPRGPDSLRCWLCSESSSLCTEKLSIVSQIKTRDKQKRCDFWGGELRRVGAAVQRSVLGRGISNTCLIIRVKYWVGTLSARFTFSEGWLWDSVLQALCERVCLVLHPGDVEASHLCKVMAGSSFPAWKKAFNCFRARESSGRVAEAAGGFLSVFVALRSHLPMSRLVLESWPHLDLPVKWPRSCLGNQILSSSDRNFFFVGEVTSNTPYFFSIFFEPHLSLFYIKLGLTLASVSCEAHTGFEPACRSGLADNRMCICTLCQAFGLDDVLSF